MSVLVNIGLVIVCYRLKRNRSVRGKVLLTRCTIICIIETIAVTSPVPQYENVELITPPPLPPPLSVDELQLESCAAYGVVSH